MSTEALLATDNYSAARSTAPRIALKDIEGYIDSLVYLNLGDAIERTGQSATRPTFLTTLCVLTLRNGFVVVGKSAPMSAGNFDKEKGQVFAYEDAIRSLWPLFAFAALDRRADD